MTRVCPQCKINKSLSLFHTDRSRKLKVAIYCKDCTKDRLNKWRIEHKDKARLQCRNYYYRYLDKNRQRVLDWEKANPELNSKGSSVYFHRKRANGIITRQLLESVYRKFDYCCRYCGSKTNLSLDHIKPVSLGGDNSFDNLQVLCMTCNLSKGNRDKPYKRNFL